MAAQKNLPVFGFDEIAKHRSRTSCWIAIHGNVYDISAMLGDHPGGDSILLEWSGKDATDEFEVYGHSESARTWQKEFLIGTVDPASQPQQATPTATKGPTGAAAAAAKVTQQADAVDTRFSSLWFVVLSVLAVLFTYFFFGL
eukprot:gnl/Hemi2/9665_TR3359_c0_g1_i1.p1 gnl/Hemi2/9665_TR3359_c0_g1~~gnl/Hemi2/9665_TR3359_c0_g1_i1.p1  ORF type:complete len:143 (-),score=45.29 gnl/Hemi2/9665_TR3359_c0_g1_i1:119-547(-)